MDPSLPRLSLLVALLLGFSQAAVQWNYTNCADSNTCPGLLELYYDEGIEVRKQDETVWMSTELTGTSSLQILAARNRLENYRDANSVSENTWPGVIKVVLSDENNVNSEAELRMMWLVPSDKVSSLSNSDDVILETIPEGKLYVSRFDELPSVEGGKHHVEDLRDDLDAESMTFYKKRYYAAGFNGYFESSHHDEIWLLETEP